MKAESKPLHEIIREVDTNYCIGNHELVEEVAKKYHQSKLQALKEEVEDIPCSGNTFHAENFKKRVLNFITNLEDNG